MSALVPSGFKEALSKFPSPFDKETLVDDDKELWLIRIPDNLEEDDIANLRFKAPSRKTSTKALGKLEKEDNKYALYKVPTDKDENDDMDEEEGAADLGISGHEMLGFDCLVPSREDNGKLAFAPKKFDQYLILNQVVEIPDSTTLAQSILDKPVYKRDQPEGLKMRFLPYGSLSGNVENTTTEVKMEEATTTTKLEDNDVDSKKRKRVSEESEQVTEEKKKVKKEKKEKKEKKDKKKDKKEKK